MILGIAGKAGSGKDTLADIMEDYFDVKKYNLADPIKECMNMVFNWGHDHAYGEFKDRSILVNIGVATSFIDLATAKIEACFCDVTEFDSRKAANKLFDLIEPSVDTAGLAIVSPRQIYQWFGTECGRDIFGTDFWLDQVPNKELVILPDIRFENEADYVRKYGVLIHVIRPDVIEVAEHSSESGVEYTPADTWLVNDGTLEEFNKAAIELTEGLARIFLIRGADGKEKT